jgi:hypothetical protein
MWTQRDWDIFAQHWVERKRSFWKGFMVGTFVTLAVLSTFGLVLQ